MQLYVILVFLLVDVAVSRCNTPTDQTSQIHQLVLSVYTADDIHYKRFILVIERDELTTSEAEGLVNKFNMIRLKQSSYLSVDVIESIVSYHMILKKLYSQCTDY